MSEGKLEPRVRKCIFMGYGLGVKGYRVWCEKSKRIITSRDVVFDENALVASIVENTLTNTAGTSDDILVEVEPPNIDETNDDAQHEKETIFPSQREKRRIIPQRRYIEECDYVAYALTIASEVESVNVPNSYKEATASRDSSKWLVAMKQDIESLAKNKTWKSLKHLETRKLWGVNGYSRRKRDQLAQALRYTRQELWHRDSLKLKELIFMRFSHRM